MNIQGYCIIKSGAEFDFLTMPDQDPKEFWGKPIRIMDFGVDGSVMVVNNNGNMLATFKKEDIAAMFKCEMQGNVVCPPGLNEIDKLLYVGKCLGRKGGYNDIIRYMVICASLHKNEFNDSVLWAKQ